MLNSEFSAEAGEKFRLDVIVSDPDPGDRLVFWDNTNLFDIDADTGRIEFTPGEGDAGTHTITIFVSDGNLTVEKTITLTIEGTDTGLTILAIMIIIILVIGVFMVILVFMVHRRNLAKIRAGQAERKRTENRKKDKSRKPEDEEDSEAEEEE
jgi:hypothetical protein